MPVLRLKVNFGGDETPRKNVLLEERMKWGHEDRRRRTKRTEVVSKPVL